MPAEKKERLQTEPKFTVKAEGAPNLHKWLTTYHQATKDAIPLGNDLTPALIVGDMDVDDGFLKKCKRCLRTLRMTLLLNYQQY